MSSLIFHTRASTLCRATGASETCRCVASPTGPAHTTKHTHTHTCPHSLTHILHIHSNNVLCALSSDCPATAAASAAATQNQPPAATNPGEAGLCVCVCPSACVVMCMYLSECECVLMCVCVAHKGNSVIVIVAAFRHSAISIRGPESALT